MITEPSSNTSDVPSLRHSIAHAMGAIREQLEHMHPLLFTGGWMILSGQLLSGHAPTTAPGVGMELEYRQCLSSWSDEIDCPTVKWTHFPFRKPTACAILAAGQMKL